MKSFVDRTKVKNDGTLIVQTEAIEIIPNSFEDMEDVVARIRKGESVVLTLKDLPTEHAQRMLDFATGAVYAMNGSAKKVKENKYVLIPPGGRVKKIREYK